MSNSLAEVHPELIADWSEKNLPLTVVQHIKCYSIPHIKCGKYCLSKRSYVTFVLNYPEVIRLFICGFIPQLLNKLKR